MLNLEYREDNKVVKTTASDLEEALALQNKLRGRRGFGKEEVVSVIGYDFGDGVVSDIKVRELYYLTNNSFRTNGLEDYKEMIKDGKVGEEDFWNAIEIMNWPSDHDHERISQELKDGVYGSRGKATSLSLIFKEKSNRLYDALEDRLDALELDYDDVIGLGDDSLSDLIANIIGCGKKAYEKSLRDPVYAASLGNPESFAYSFSDFYI